MYFSTVKNLPSKKEVRQVIASSRLNDAGESIPISIILENTFDAGEYTYLSEGRWGTRTPSYRRLRAQGLLPENNFGYWKVVNQESRSGTSWTSNSASYIERWNNTSLIPFSGGEIFPDSTEWNEMKTDLHYKMQDQAKSSTWNVPVFAAELGKTAQMVGNTAATLVHGLRALRRGNLGEFSDIFHLNLGARKRSRYHSDFLRRKEDAVSGAWLQYKYGWLPFMSDVSDAVNTLMDTAEVPQSLDNSMRPLVKRKTRDVTKVTNTQFGQVRASYDIVIQRELTLRALWRYSVQPMDIPGRFGLTNPFEVVWELVPFSFVADWFLPVGNYLSQFDFSSRFVHRSGSYGYKLETSSSIDNLRLAYPQPGYAVWGGQHLRSTYIIRRPMVGLPINPLSSLAMSAGITTASRALSSVALLQQVFRGSR